MYGWKVSELLVVENEDAGYSVDLVLLKIWRKWWDNKSELIESMLLKNLHPSLLKMSRVY